MLPNFKDLKIKYKILMGNALAIILLLLFSLLVYKNIQTQRTTSQLVLHSEKAISMANEVMGSMIDMETGLRGFVITGKEEFLEPYLKGERDFHNKINIAKEFLAEYPTQVERLESIENLSNKWKKEVGEKEIKLRREINNGGKFFEELVLFVEGRKGKKTVDHLRLDVNKFIQAEQKLLRERRTEAENSAKNFILLVFSGMTVGSLIIIFTAFWIAGRITGPIDHLVSASQAIARGDLSRKLNIAGNDEIGELAKNFETMSDNLSESKKILEAQTQLKSNLNAIFEKVYGLKNVKDISDTIFSEIAPLVDAVCCAFFVMREENNALHLSGSYGYNLNNNANPKEFIIGEGLVGECAQTKKPIFLDPAPSDYVKVASGIGDGEARYLILQPILIEDRLLGVMEIASFNSFSKIQHELINQVAMQSGIILNGVLGHAD